MSEREFDNRLKQIQAENVQKERLAILKKEKNKYKKKFKVKLPSTSKLILLVASLLCFQIVIEQNRCAMACQGYGAFF